MITTNAPQITYEDVNEQFLAQNTAPEVTICVSLQKNSGIDYWIMQKNRPLPISGGWTPANNIPIADSFWGDLDSILKDSVQLTNLTDNELRSIWFRIESVGKYLYEQFIPTELQALATKWPVGSTILVATNEKWIPWELIHDGTDFWGSKFILARIPKIPEQSTFSPPDEPIKYASKADLCKVVNVIGGELLPRSSVTRIRNLFLPLSNNVSIQIKEKPTLYEVVQAIENADLVHFTCHGHLKPTPCLQLADDPHSSISCLTVLDVKQLTHISHSIIFANACTSVGISEFLGELRNFGWEFYKKGSAIYIGTLGLIPTAYAIEFAEFFYGQILKGISVGEALRHAKASVARGNPFWLLYSLYGDPFTRKLTPKSLIVSNQ